MALGTSRRVIQVTLTGEEARTENTRRTIEALRKWAKGHNVDHGQGVEIWPAGTSNVIEVSCCDSCDPSSWEAISWEAIKEAVGRIVGEIEWEDELEGFRRLLEISAGRK